MSAGKQGQVLNRIGDNPGGSWLFGKGARHWYRSGLDYYTGTVYETFIVGHEEYGSVMSSGRYDEMIGQYSKQGQPAVGICLGVVA